MKNHRCIDECAGIETYLDNVGDMYIRMTPYASVFVKTRNAQSALSSYSGGVELRLPVFMGHINMLRMSLLLSYSCTMHVFLLCFSLIGIFLIFRDNGLVATPRWSRVYSIDEIQTHTDQSVWKTKLIHH